MQAIQIVGACIIISALAVALVVEERMTRARRKADRRAIENEITRAMKIHGETNDRGVEDLWDNYIEGLQFAWRHLYGEGDAP
jgi:hypothetical protein